MSYILLKDFIGKDRGWKVNMMTIELWSKQLDDSAFQSTSLYGAVYAGLVANCKVKQEEPDFTYEDISDLVDEMNLTDEGRKVLSDIKFKFEESQYYIELIKRLKQQVDEIESGKKKEVEIAQP